MNKIFLGHVKTEIWQSPDTIIILTVTLIQVSVFTCGFFSLFRDKDNKFSLLFALSCINCRTHLFTDSFDTLVRFRDPEGGRWEIIEEVYECRLNADKIRLQQDPPGNPAEPVNTATHSDSGLWITARRGKPASV